MGGATLYIGLDFGTTFSGVAYAISTEGKHPDEHTGMYIVRRWPTTATQNRFHTRVKVPSKLHYGADGELFWGYLVPEEVSEDLVFEWFKLLLADEEDIPTDVFKSKKLTRMRQLLNDMKPAKTVVDVVADYLRLLWKHALVEIGKTQQMPLDIIPIHVTITVPAIWKDSANKRMKSAVQRAGILDERTSGIMEAPELSLVPEPEAAARATLPSLQARREIDMSEGDSFIICDCGGGTVDIISYTMENMNPLVISECVAGDGDLCGGVFLDEEFERAMKSNLGAEVWDAASPTELKDMAMDWEVGIKECIAGDPQAKFTIRLAGNTWRLSGGEIMRCFRIIKPKIKRLVKAQIDGIKAKKKLPKLVILVGGFGRCQYIRHFLTEDKGPCRAIRVMQNPDDASVSAIARGAVLAGIDGCKQADDIHAQGGTLIRARCSRFSYGWVFDDYFDPEKHSEEDKVFDEVRSRHMAQDQFAWVILKGDEVASVSNRHQFDLVFSEFDSGPIRKSYRIYECASENPPTSLRASRCSPTPLKAVDTLVLKMPGKIEELPMTINNDGKVIYTFEYEWKVEAAGATLGLTAWHDDKIISHKEIDIDGVDAQGDMDMEDDED